jgi:hypothetical protein
LFGTLPVALVEFVDSASSVDDLLLPSVKGVT